MSKAKYNKKQLGLLISIILIATVTVGGTLAWLIDHTDAVTNTFEPTEVTCAIDETMEDNVKTDVKVKNTGGVDAYIRAAIVVTWQDSEGNISSVKPVEGMGNDYVITFSDNRGWRKGSDGYYYYSSAVAPKALTDVLIETCYPLNVGPEEGYTLHVEIIADAVQATPAQAVIDAWGVTVTNGTISPNTTN